MIIHPKNVAAYHCELSVGAFQNKKGVVISLRYVVLLNKTSKETPEDITVAHGHYLKDMHEGKKVVYSGPLEKIGGMVVYDANSKEEARKLVELDPFVSGNYREYEIYEWKQTIGL
ncbi:YciI family protein [Peribacillus cavernae]|uniref:YciI family protein n=1 Tax=Peribacillus cavernae TaxID=1674310 RepID=UPI00163D3B05|nr:YciI family protein [Peribacillus cavernae]MDQ0218642.1 uncharacterized protein YciI [Peribacillus cavernae]